MYTIFDDIQAAVVRMMQHVAPPRQLEPAELDILHRVPPTVRLQPVSDLA